MGVAKQGFKENRRQADPGESEVGKEAKDIPSRSRGRSGTQVGKKTTAMQDLKLGSQKVMQRCRK